METLEAIQTRHRKEQRDLQSRITNKKKNATKKTRKGINDECAALERDLKERQELELDALNGERDVDEQEGEEPNGAGQNTAGNGTENSSSTIPDTNHIMDRLKDTTISSDAPPSTQSSQPPSKTQTQSSAAAAAQTQAQPQEQGGKKRNRQKDRLARRAAEREVAAEAAEKEAQDMTDHRGLERTSLERAFSAHGLVEHEIRPDGHCLFSAVADQLAQRRIQVSPPSSSSSRHNGVAETSEEDAYRVVRRVATEYMEDNADDFAPFLEEPLASYVPKIRDTAEWGGQLELLALASAYRVEIKVVQNGRTETIQPSGGLGLAEAGGDGDGDGDRTIWLAYYRHGYGLGEHYNSLRKKKKS
ncbi:OTU domain-containing protein 6B [Xylaria sp. FL1777]|nr:OTU domain-containing protein 6B [Xylaria sp. FL1777]